MVTEGLEALVPESEQWYALEGRPSIAQKKLLRAELLLIFFTIRGQRQLMEQIDYDLLFRWFVGFPMEYKVWNQSTFSHSLDRLLEAGVAGRCFGRPSGSPLSPCSKHSRAPIGDGGRGQRR